MHNDEFNIYWIYGSVFKEIVANARRNLNRVKKKRKKRKETE